MGRVARNEIATHNGWFYVNVAIAMAIVAYGIFLLWEATHAQSQTVVSVTVVSSSISLSCDGTVQLGTITDYGDTGAYNSSRATACTVSTSNALGYSLKWQVTTGSGGTNTGYLINQNEQVIAPYSPQVSGTPETWSVDSAAAEWGGRLSSTSTTVSTGTWGTDGSSEKWLNVGTGAYTIANRSTATSGGGDTERVGFRTEIGSGVAQQTGTYSATVVLTAITN